MTLRRTLTCTVLLLILAIRVASAQNSITGKVLDPQGKPVPNTQVILHAVQEKSGNEVDKDTTNADGTFTVRARTIEPNAVYFVAVVWNGSLYIGDLMRAPFPAQQQYVVTVGVNPIDVRSPATAPTQVTPQAAEHDRTAGILVVVVAALAILAIVLFALRRRPPARRRWLVELARLEAELEANPEERPALQKRRAELRARLKAAQSS